MTMSDCIIPERKLDSNGYTIMKFKGRYQGTHRVAWQILYGPIGKGIVLDHICHNEALERGECSGGTECVHRACVNPQHLRKVTHLENVRSGARVMANNTHCVNGHEVATNLRYRPSGRAYCQECRNQSNAKSVLRQKMRLAK